MSFENYIRRLYNYRNLPFILLKQINNAKRNKSFVNCSILNFSKLKEKYKKTDTLFIMGSGPSINSLTNDQFLHIKKNDSFGFTNWTMHEHVPTYYMNEFKRRTPELDRCGEQELTNLFLRKEDYQDTALIFRAGETFFDQISGFEKYGLPFKDIYMSLDIPLIGKNENEISVSFQLLKNLGILNSNFIQLNKTASLFRTIIFGFKMGYKKIVLCGFDLTGDLYFWEQEEEFYKSKNLVFPILTAHRNKDHKTNTKGLSTGGMIISELVYATKKMILDANNVELYVASENSALYPHLYKYNWDSQGLIS